MKHFTLVILSTLLLCSAIAGDAPASVAELFVTPENARLVREADKVDVCILRHIEPAVRADGSVDRSTERYEEMPFSLVPTATATVLRDLVLDEKTYDWKASGGGRRPQFYLRLRFHRGGEFVAVDFCFTCHALNVARKGEALGHANFGRNGDLFLQAFLKVFPHDEMLKQIARETGLPP